MGVVEGRGGELGRVSGSDGAADEVMGGADMPWKVGGICAGLGASVAQGAALVVLAVLVACAVAGPSC